MKPPHCLNLTLALLLSAVCAAEDDCWCQRPRRNPDVQESVRDAPRDAAAPERIMTAQRLVESSRPTFRWEPSEAARDWQFIVLHHSATASGSVESIHREHGQRKDRYGNNWLGIGYHFVIGNGSGMEDGEISPTFRWKGQIHGAHSGSTTHNATGIGICVIGNFENHPPSERQLTALTELLIALSRNYNIPESRIIPHSVVRATACPGSKFPLKELLQRIKSES